MPDERHTAAEITEKLKALIKKGGAAKILVLRNERTVAVFPVTMGLIAGAAAPWAAVAAAVAALGFRCSVRLVKADGRVVRVI